MVVSLFSSGPSGYARECRRGRPAFGGWRRRWYLARCPRGRRVSPEVRWCPVSRTSGRLFALGASGMGAVPGWRDLLLLATIGSARCWADCDNRLQNIIFQLSLFSLGHPHRPAADEGAPNEVRRRRGDNRLPDGGRGRKRRGRPIFLRSVHQSDDRSKGLGRRRQRQRYNRNERSSTSSLTTPVTQVNPR